MKYTCVSIAAFLLIGFFANSAQAQWWVGGRSYALRVDKYDSFYGEARPIWWSCQLPQRAPHFRPPTPFGYDHRDCCDQTIGEGRQGEYYAKNFCSKQRHSNNGETHSHHKVIDLNSSKIKQSQKPLLDPTCYQSNRPPEETLDESKILHRLIRYESQR